MNPLDGDDEAAFTDGMAKQSIHLTIDLLKLGLFIFRKNPQSAADVYGLVLSLNCIVF